MLTSRTADVAEGERARLERERIRELFKMEFDLNQRKRQQAQLVKDLRIRETRQRRKANKDPEAAVKADELKTQADELEAELPGFELSAADKREREKLRAQAFGTWNKGDFTKFVKACARHGRKAKQTIYNDVANATGKSDAEEFRTKERGEVIKIVISLGFRPFPPIKWTFSPQLGEEELRFHWAFGHFLL